MIKQGVSTAFANLLVASFLGACDSGDIYPKHTEDEQDSYTAHVTATLEGMDKWPTGYMLAIAAFTDESEYSVIQKQINTADGKVDILLTNIPMDATSLELCVTNSLRLRIATIVSLPIEKGWDRQETLKLDAGKQNVGMFAMIQRDIFDGTSYNCSSCHGAVNPRASLSLSEGASYQNLVGVASTRVADGTRVVAGHAEKSVLHQVLEEGNPAGLRYDHSPLVNSRVLKLIDDWINNGAKE